MNRSLKLLLAINSVFVLAGNLLGPLYAIFIEQLGGGVVVASGTWGVMLLTTTLVNFLLIRYGDSIREHEYLLIGGFFLRSIAWLGFALHPNILAIVVLQTLIGAGEAVGSTGFDAIFAEHLDRNHHVRDYASWKTISNFLASIAVVVGGYIVTTFGFAPMFLAMSITAAFCGIITYLLPRRTL